MTEPAQAMASAGGRGMVSIVLPHYQTAELVKLCLRAIRHFTPQPYEVIVVDNASGEGDALSYLRSVEWIRLIERPAGSVPTAPAEAHASAMNIGINEARGEYYLAMHTDTIPLCREWLDALVRPMLNDPQMGAVGCDKIDARGGLAEAIKSLSDVKAWRRLPYRLLNRPLPKKLQVRPPHARSFCALYRQKHLLDYALSFTPTKYQTAGEDIYYELLERGHRAHLFPPRQMRQWVAHVVHATAYLSPERLLNNRRVRSRTERRVHELFQQPWVRQLLDDSSLDRARAR